jgi:hypothetical protein
MFELLATALRKTRRDSLWYDRDGGRNSGFFALIGSLRILRKKFTYK